MPETLRDFLKSLSPEQALKLFDYLVIEYAATHEMREVLRQNFREDEIFWRQHNEETIEGFSQEESTSIHD